MNKKFYLEDVGLEWVPNIPERKIADYLPEKLTITERGKIELLVEIVFKMVGNLVVRDMKKLKEYLGKKEDFEHIEALLNDSLKISYCIVKKQFIVEKFELDLFYKLRDAKEDVQEIFRAMDPTHQITHLFDPEKANEKAVRLYIKKTGVGLIELFKGEDCFDILNNEIQKNAKNKTEKGMKECKLP